MNKKKTEIRIGGNRWLPLDECTMTDAINAVHCDTRDFHCLLVEEDVELPKTVQKAAEDERYTVEPDKVFDLLKKAETLSGGKISFRILSTPNSYWLKYIRFFRVGDKFVATDRNGVTPLAVDSLNAENLKIKNI